MAEKFWTGVAIDIETALAAAKTITAITKASPAVVSSTAHGYSNGDYVVLSVTGMFELDNVVARVAGVATDSFQLEGIDSTAFNTFVSGTAQKLTLGAAITTALSINASGGQAQFTDVTTVHDLVQRRAPTTVSPVSMTIESKWKPSDTGLLELNRATRSKTTRAILITFTDGTKMIGSAYVSAPLVPTGSGQEVVKTPVELEFQGLPTVYAS